MRLIGKARWAVPVALLLLLGSGCRERADTEEPDDGLVRLRSAPVTMTATAVEPQNDWTLAMQPDQTTVPRGSVIVYTIQWTRTAEGYVIESWATLYWWRGGVEQTPIESAHCQVQVTDVATGIRFALPLPLVVQGQGAVEYVVPSLFVDGSPATPDVDPETGLWSYGLADLPGSGSGQLTYRVKAL